MDENDRIAIAVLEANAKNTDANLHRLEAKVDAGFAEIKADMKSGFQRLDGRIDKVEARFDKVDARIDKLDAKVDRLDMKVDTAKDSISALAISTEKGFGLMKDESKKDFRWTIGIFGGGVVFLAGFMYFLFSRIPAPTTEAKPKDISAISAPAPASMPVPTPTPALDAEKLRRGKKQ